MPVVRIIAMVLRTLWRLLIAAVLLAAVVGFFIARYFLRLVSSMTKIFAP